VNSFVPQSIAFHFARPAVLALAILFVPISNRAASLSRTNLLEWQAQNKTIQPVRTATDWGRRRKRILEAMSEVMGPLPDSKKRCPLDVKIVEEVDCGAYTRKFLNYASEPGCRTPAYLLIPKELSTDRKAMSGILCLHQTGSPGPKLVVGLGDNPDDQYAVELAKAGFVCIAPAYPGFGDYSPDLRQLGYESGTMKAIWDNMRALDLLDTLDFVRHDAFGALGHSLGGHNAIFTAAFDPRIKAVVSSCGLDSFQDYMDGDIRGWTSQTYMPNLLNYSLANIPFDFPEVIAAIAPRDVLLIAPKGDTNFKWQSVDRVVAEARPVFQLLGAADNLQVEHPAGGHAFPPKSRGDAYNFLGEKLRGKPE
jgi:dienelactone hydrolase